MNKSPYKINKEIEYNLFQGIVIPTAESQGYDIRNQKEIVRMMEALVKKYHAMTKEERKVLIKKAKINIKEKMEKINEKITNNSNSDS